MADIYKILSEYFGYHSFRPGQEEIISSILDKRDVLAVMPTGAGKSVCYQIPALMLEGITVVVSPLISLMQDQVRSLLAMGIRGAYLNSSLTPNQLILATKRAKEGAYKIIYVAPERLLTESFIDLAKSVRISLLAVDEAHCISQWGHEFRPSYTKISDFIELLPYRPITAAFTATATAVVKRDISEKLRLCSPFELTTGFDRPNLYFAVYKPLSKESWILNYIERKPDEAGIIYCSSRKAVERLCEELILNGISALPYHAGMSDEARSRNQNDFIYDKARIIVATSAFGMGINKPNVRFVIHYHMPRNVEQYYQEAGRAGRDGENAECILLYNGADVSLNKFMINKSCEENESLSYEEREAFRTEELEKLKLMTFYSTSKKVCLRKRILNYFGENTAQSCNNCSVCDALNEIDRGILASTQTREVETDSEKTPPDSELFGRLKLLRKSIAERQSVPAYVVFSDSALREMSKKKPKNERELLTINGVGNRKLERYGKAFLEEIKKYLTENGYDEETLTSEQESKAGSKSKADPKLFDILKQLRKNLAEEEKVPAYFIFSDVILHEISEKKPKNKAELLEIKGVGSVKLERYGKAFLEEIRKYLEEMEVSE